MIYAMYVHFICILLNLMAVIFLIFQTQCVIFIFQKGKRRVIECPSDSCIYQELMATVEI